MSPIKLIVGDSKTTIEGADKATIKLLDERTSYRLEGAHFSPSFRQRRWDGKVHTLRYSARYGLRLYTGLAPLAVRWLRNHGSKVEVVDARRPPSRTVRLRWLADDLRLRPYQKKAVQAVLDTERVVPGRGMLQCAVRSGKTVIAAGIIYATQARTIFLVDQERQFKQTVKLFRRIFGYDAVGAVGSGLAEYGRPIAVAMVQTLYQRRQRTEVKRLLKSVDLVFADECHHLKNAETFKLPMRQSDAYYKVGLSATIYISHKGDDNEKGAVWLQALTGPRLYSVSTRRLIKLGFLVPATVRMLKVNGPEVIGGDWHKVQDEGIVRHETRNRLAALMARRSLERGRKVLVIAHRLEHLDLLEAQFAVQGIADQVVRVDGRVPHQERDERVRRFTSGERPLLLGNVFKEAVDIPQIEDVIVCEGGKDRKAAIQRMRNLTPSDGKAKRVYLFDFADLHNPILAAHSAARLKAYKAEGCFDFQVVNFEKKRRAKVRRRRP